MSDPVTNMEIEDVLSSIRRLVSEDSRPKQPKSAPDRLVLTPAHRVVEEPQADESPETAEAEDAPAETPVLLTNPTVVEPEAAQPAEPEPEVAEVYARLVSVETEEVTEVALQPEPEIVAEEAPDPQPETAETVDPETLSVSALRDEATPLMAFARKLAEAGEQMDSEELDAEPEVAEDAAPLPVEEDTPEEQSAPIEDAFAEEDEAVSATDILGQLVEQEVSRVFAGAYDDEIDEGEEDTPEPAQEAAPRRRDPFEALIESAAPAPAEEAAEEDSPQAEATPAPVQTLESKIAALEKMVAGQSGEWEADVAEEPAFVHRPAKTMAWQEPAPEEAETAEADDIPEVAPAPAAETPSAEIVEATSRDEQGLAAIDETTLRLMVSEIVRQELQGALGERITRNVRKLVRREIHRAMMSNDFD